MIKRERKCEQCQSKDETIRRYNRDWYKQYETMQILEGKLKIAQAQLNLANMEIQSLKEG